MTIEPKLVARWVLILTGLSCPVWLPLMEGYLFSIYKDFIANPSVSTVESTNLLVVVTAFILGNISAQKCCGDSLIATVITFFAYSAVAVIALFFTGWLALLMVGYGH